MKSLLTLLIAVALGITGCNKAPQTKEAKIEGETLLRFGHFPNVTHAQGVIAHHLSRQGKGWYEERLGPNVGSMVYLQRQPLGHGGDFRELH
jgi:NitT/TauT family transport system substrate-binding protein